MYRRCFEFITQLNPSTLDIMEISAGPQWVCEFNFHFFTDMKYPEYDICAQTLDWQFDLIIADQIFEHLKWTYRAGRNVFAMLKPGDHFIVETPFLIRVHRVPIDCSRWTENGISYLLQECGFPATEIKTAPGQPRLREGKFPPLADSRVPVSRQRAGFPCRRLGLCAKALETPICFDGEARLQSTVAAPSKPV